MGNKKTGGEKIIMDWETIANNNKSNKGNEDDAALFACLSGLLAARQSAISGGE